MEKLSQPKEIFEALYNYFLRLADSSGGSWDQTPAPESPALAAFVGGDSEADRLLCARAMAAIYDHHAGAVGELLLWLLKARWEREGGGLGISQKAYI